jgi:hypothetical protein
MKRRSRPPPFYALDADLPLVLAITSGLQHALAMLAGLITPPIILAASLNLDAETSAYMISASLIGCGTYLFFFDDWRVFMIKFGVSRDIKSGANVPNTPVSGLLSRDRTSFGGRDQFCDVEHGERGMSARNMYVHAAGLRFF